MGVNELRSVALTPDRIDGGLLLSAEAGWNQVAADWSFMLGSGSSFGFTDGADRLVASGLTVDFPRFAWISMILVTPEWRRKGLATRLMQSCTEALLARNLVPALDASQEGREVYLRLGFRDGETITRLAGNLGSLTNAISGEISPIGSFDLAEIIAYDSRSSGTDRTALLGHLAQRLPRCGFLARRGGKIAGYVMARDGRMSAQIGPLLADDEETALALLAAAGRAADGNICLDLFDRRKTMRAWLDAHSFVPVTRFIRMVHGSTDIFPADHRVYVIAGPELG
jgi:GNAT superfamily N-acetyltransferase